MTGHASGITVVHRLVAALGGDGAQVLRPALDAAARTDEPEVDPRARRAAEHLGLACCVPGPDSIVALKHLAVAAHIEPAALEAALIALDLRHGAGFGQCQGGPGCSDLAGDYDEQVAHV